MIMNRQTLFVVGYILVVTGIVYFAIKHGAKPSHIALAGFIAFGSLIIAFAAAVLWQIIEGKIALSGIISEPETIAKVDDQPKASLSRFQFLIFTFVVAGLFLMLSIEAGAFVQIPDSVLILIGLSGGSFVISKAVGQSNPPATKGDTPPQRLGAAGPTGSGGAEPIDENQLDSSSRTTSAASSTRSAGNRNRSSK